MLLGSDKSCLEKVHFEVLLEKVKSIG